MIDLLIPTVAQGLLWALMALGVYVTFRVLDIADLTVEGSFPLGAATAASMMVAGYGPIASLFAAFVTGTLAGVVTGLLHTKMKIPALLAGILTMIALYSVNLRIMGKANLSLLGVDTSFKIARNMLGMNMAQTTLIVGLIVTVIVGTFMYWFFGTQIGAAIRATGFNQQMIRAQGLLWALMALGVYVTFRVLDIADLTVEGSFPLGAATAASMMVAGYGPIASLFAAFVTGTLAGVVTGLLHTKMKIPALLAGILTMIALYSVNLRIMGKANLSLLGVDTSFKIARNMLGMNMAQTTLIVGLIVTVIVGTFMYWFFGTQIGAAIRATGFNQQMIRAQGVDTDVTIILGLLISNGLVAVSGALVAQSNGFSDVGMGTGTIVIGLASVIIGEVLFGTRSFKNCLVSVVLGSIVYRIVIATVLAMGMPPNDLKLFTSVLVALALSMPLIKAKLSGRKVVH